MVHLRMDLITWWACSYAVVSLARTNLMTDEQRLLGDIFHHYDRLSRPVYNAKYTVHVNFGLTLVQILDMDEKNQALTTNVWLEQTWVDERISWNVEYYNNITALRVPAYKLWLPDIVLYNNVDDFDKKLHDINAVILPDGLVIWAPPALFKSSCKVDVTYFPFDHQTCSLKFGSWMYDISQVDIMNKTAEADMSIYIPNGEWIVESTRFERQEMVYPIAPTVYPDVTLYIRISRRIKFYFVNLILPCLWINALSLMTFLLPPESGEKMALSITVLLSYTIFMILVTDMVPPTSEQIPLIGVYLIVSMGVTSITVILTVFILKVNYSGVSRHPPPRWLKSLVYNWMNGIFTCCHRSIVIESTLPENYEEHHTAFTAHEYVDTDDEETIVTRLTKSDNTDTVEDTKNVPKTGATDTSKTAAGLACEEKRIRVLISIRNKLRKLALRKVDADMRKLFIKEWREIALAIDCFLAKLFLAVYLASIGALIILVPIIKYRLL